MGVHSAVSHMQQQCKKFTIKIARRRTKWKRARSCCCGLIWNERKTRRLIRADPTRQMLAAPLHCRRRCSDWPRNKIEASAAAGVGGALAEKIGKIGAWLKAPAVTKWINYSSNWAFDKPIFFAKKKKTNFKCTYTSDIKRSIISCMHGLYAN